MSAFDFFQELQGKLSNLELEYFDPNTPADRLHWIEVQVQAVARALDTTAIDLKEARLKALGLRK